MNEIRTPPSIIVGIDGSRAAIQAALWAIDEAVSRDIPLRLLYAIEPENAQVPPDRAARKLAIAENAVRYAFTALEAAEKPVKIEVEVVQDRAITALIRASASAEMVCVGAVGLHHVRPDRMGSTAAALAVSAHCPVAIIRGDNRRSGQQARWIVVDAEGAGSTDVVLEAAFAEAQLRNAPLRAVARSASGRGDADCRIEVELDRRLERCRRNHPDVRVESAALHGSLLTYLEKSGRTVQLVVVSVRNREHVDQLVGLMGNSVLHGAGCSVLVVDHQPR
ncbi:universal stress protein [Mycobacterium intermedium]|uniref:Universal stress protein n=1 Tax=Mycobacterium intermedium TaxID=28445 RepID=A0A1E3SFH0_MYCIE|nr:universal stress protein [Mycobacterium intermedium]MCV6966690.1 universal stress protein [Mycobacterium intermedium]ODR00835.1 universal stress protein [Mycobacterium intermedium]OPE52112.1 universal stress protein [Mycobacterium intermedium]ORB10676.1 universal stress protein [Mycobacterium intermedium]